MFYQRDKIGATSFYPLEIKKTTFLLNVIGKCLISNSRSMAKAPSSDAHVHSSGNLVCDIKDS